MASPELTGSESTNEREAAHDSRDNGHTGHRDRLRARFVRNGHEALQDYELLELLLFRLIPRRDTKPIAKALLARFGNISSVLGAPVHLLCETPGIGRSVANDLKVVAAVNQRMLHDGIIGKPVMASWTAVIDYCRAAMSFEDREQFRILFLDKKNAVIADEVQHSGTVDHTPAYPREVVRRALELASTALILVHNHPSGDPQPSRADIEMTQRIVEASKPMGIVVHDHIIIGKGNHSSLKSLGLM